MLQSILQFLPPMQTNSAHGLFKAVQQSSLVKSWIDGTKANDEIRLFKLTKLQSVPKQDPYVKILSLVIQPSGHYSLYALGRETTQETLEKV